MEATQDQIRSDRRRLQNPYAHLGSEDGFEAVISRRDSGVHDARRVLENPYAGLSADGSIDEKLLAGFSTSREAIVTSAELTRGCRGESSAYTRAEVQRIVRRLHARIWSQRERIWPDHAERRPIDMLDPSVGLRLLGYEVSLDESLGQAQGIGDIFEVAGEVDNQQKLARISRRFGHSVRSFTAAHELGHAVLHPEISGLHRDRALDGTGVGGRPTIEWQADIFATHFLMPARLVREEFEISFMPPPFALSEESAFALRARSVEALEMEISTLRDLSRIIASAEHFSGRHFTSLASRFRVSVEAIAIRLEELALVQYR